VRPGLVGWLDWAWWPGLASQKNLFVVYIFSEFVLDTIKISLMQQINSRKTEKIGFDEF
jgi:hypothetical protein